MKIKNRIKNSNRLVLTALLFVTIAMGYLYVRQASAATSLPALSSFNPTVLYPSVPVSLESQMNKRVYVDMRYHPYSNHGPYFYLEEAGDTAYTPYFEIVITRNGSEIYRCRNDWAVFDTCSGHLAYDNSPPRGSSHTYSAYVEKYSRHPDCKPSGNNVDPDCGKKGNLQATSPTKTKTVYVGTENPPRIRSKLSYDNYTEGRDPVTGRSRKLLVPKDEAVTFSWSRGDAAGMQYAGDAADSCTLTHTINGTAKILDANAPESDTRVIPVGNELGQHSLSIQCFNGAGKDSPGASGGIFEVVEDVPEGYYSGAPKAGGGGAAIALPQENRLGDLDGDGETDSSQKNLSNIFSETSGTYVAMKVDKCTVGSAGFMASPVVSEVPAEQAFTYPFGVLSFKLSCDTPGQTVTVTKYYYTEVSATNASLRKFNSATGTTRPVTEASLENVTIGGRSAIKVSYPVTDGGKYDEDGQANGAIVDPVVLSTVEEKRAEIEADCTAKQLSKDNCKIISYIVLAINTLSGLVGITVVLMITVGGIQYASSAGDPSKAAAAKKRIFSAISALVLYIFIFAFLQWLVPGGIF